MPISTIGPFSSTSVRLYRRSCTLVVGTGASAFSVQSGKRLGLTVAFRIEKSDKPEPNKSEISIYNLADAHRALVEQTGVVAFLSAGYPGAEAQIFSGNVRVGLTEKNNGTESITKLELGDGLTALTTTPFNKSWGPGTLLKDVVSDLAKQMQLDKGNLLQAIGETANHVFTKGYSTHGLPSTELTNLLDKADLNWSVQDGRIQALGATQYVGDQGPLISPNTGLIGSPSVCAPQRKGGPPVTKFKCQLNPAIHPGTRVQIQSSDLNGVFRCHKVQHNGNTRSGEWDTDVEVTKAI